MTTRHCIKLCYGESFPFEKLMRIAAGTSLTTLLQDFQTITTPSALHFEQHHNSVLAIDLSRHQLPVHDLMDRPMMFIAAEMKRFHRSPALPSLNVQPKMMDEPHDTTVQ